MRQRPLSAWTVQGWSSHKHLHAWNTMQCSRILPTTATCLQTDACYTQTSTQFVSPVSRYLRNPQDEGFYLCHLKCERAVLLWPSITEGRPRLCPHCCGFPAQRYRRSRHPGADVSPIFCPTSTAPGTACVFVGRITAGNNEQSLTHTCEEQYVKSLW